MNTSLSMKGNNKIEKGEKISMFQELRGNDEIDD